MDLFEQAIDLTWTLGTNTDKTLIRIKEGGYADNITDGTQAYFDTGESVRGMKCIRCGGCCKTVPCYFAQIYYNLTAQTKTLCPELAQNKDGTYTCKRMLWDVTLKGALLGTGCHYPEYRRDKIKI